MLPDPTRRRTPQPANISHVVTAQYVPERLWNGYVEAATSQQEEQA